MAAEAFYFFLDEKVTKNQFSQNASLPHRPLPCKSDKTTGYVLLRLRAIPSLQNP
jgi:hypothetical protein